MPLGRHIAIKVTKLGNTQHFYPDLGAALCITCCYLTQSSIYLLSLLQKTGSSPAGDYPELSLPLAD